VVDQDTRIGSDRSNFANATYKASWSCVLFDCIMSQTASALPCLLFAGAVALGHRRPPASRCSLTRHAADVVRRAISSIPDFVPHDSRLLDVGLVITAVHGRSPKWLRPPTYSMNYVQKNSPTVRLLIPAHQIEQARSMTGLSWDGLCLSPSFFALISLGGNDARARYRV
jgi:hypothetical protein